MRMCSILFWILPTLLIIGCRSSNTLRTTYRNIPFSEVQERILTHHTQIQSMMCEGRISIESPEMAQSGSFSLTLQKPDSILINLEGPFGIKVGSALITRTNFFFYNSLSNKLITGSTKKENLYRILHIQIEFDDLINLFGGGSFFNSDLHAPSEVQFDDDRFIYVYIDNNGKRQYWIDPSSLSIQKIQYLDIRGTTILEQSFKNFEEVEGIEIPFLIRLTHPKNKQTLSLSFSDVHLNTEPLCFSFTVPQNAEHINW